MSNGVAMDIDFLGVEGGRLAMAFAAGCAATWAFLRTTFTAPLRTRITELEGMVAAERKRCEAMETRLVQRRSEEHTSELQSLMRISYAVFCLKKKIQKNDPYTKKYIAHNRKSSLIGTN